MRAIALALAVVAAGCGGTGTRGQRAADEDAGREGTGRVLRGRATWYGGSFHGRKTASGERFDKGDLTAAHRTLRFGTVVRVTHGNSGRSVVVRINDRGPYGKDRRRVIDLSEAAARELDMIQSGWAPVRIEVLSEPPPRAARSRPR